MNEPIDFYFACVSPWSYLATDELKKIAEENDRKINYKPRDVGRSWKEAGAGQPIDNRPEVLLNYRLVELPRWAAWRATEINIKPKYFPVSYFLSSNVIIAAHQSGADVHQLTRALMRGCWVEELDISDEKTVSNIVSGVGLNSSEILESAKTTKVEEELSSNTVSALAAGAWSVPSIVLDKELFFGQDRLEMISWRLKGN